MLPVEEKRKLLGTIIISKKRGNLAATYTTLESSTLPTYFDWRDKDGKNWMTPVKDAAGCGACWAFAAIGAVEAAFNIFKNDSNLDLDLSEQQLISDGGACLYHGGCYGGHHEEALKYIRDTGIVDEECFPYTASDSSCNLCQDWKNRLYKIEDYFWIRQYTPNTYKEVLMEYGPLPAAVVGSDIFLYYSSGIYEPLDDETIFSGAKHAIVLVGWNDTGEYWIIKNDWAQAGEKMAMEK